MVEHRNSIPTVAGWKPLPNGKEMYIQEFLNKGLTLHQLRDLLSKIPGTGTYPIHTAGVYFKMPSLARYLPGGALHEKLWTWDAVKALEFSLEPIRVADSKEFVSLTREEFVKLLSTGLIADAEDDTGGKILSSYDVFCAVQDAKQSFVGNDLRLPSFRFASLGDTVYPFADMIRPSFAPMVSSGFLAGFDNYLSDYSKTISTRPVSTKTIVVPEEIRGKLGRLFNEWSEQQIGTMWIVISTVVHTIEGYLRENSEHKKDVSPTDRITFFDLLEILPKIVFS
jgi:hypothetical protein